MEIFKLFGSIFIDNDKANQSLDDTDKKGKGVGSTLGSAIGTAAKFGTALVGAATAAGGAMLGLAQNTADYAGEILDASRKSSLSIENLQQLKYAGEQSGVAMEDLIGTASKLNKSLAEGLDGNKTYAAAFKELGVSMTDAAGKARSSNDVYNDVLAKLAEMGDTAEATRIGTDLFGKSYSNLKPLLAEGATGIEDLKNKASELGIVMNDEAVKAGDNFGDSLDSLKQSFGGIVRDLSSNFFPMLQAGIDYVSQNMPAIKEVVGNVFNALQGSFSSVLPLIGDLATNLLPVLVSVFTDIATNVLPPLIVLFASIGQSVLPVIINLFEMLITNILPPLTDILKVVINDILPPFIRLFNVVVQTVLPPLMALISQIIQTLLPPLIQLFTQIIDAVMPVIIELFNTFTNTVLPPLMELINQIVQQILPPLLNTFNELAKIVLPLVLTVFQSLMPIIEPIMNMIAAAIRTVLALIKGDWEGVWKGIKEFFKTYLDLIVKVAEGFKNIFGGVFEAVGKAIKFVWDGIVDNIKNAVNTVTGVINGMLSTITGVVNKAIDLINKIPGVDIPKIDAPEIPKLAAGGDIVRGGRVMVGENGPEFLDLPQGARVTPLSKAGEPIDYNKLAAAIYSAFADVLNELPQQAIELIFDGTKLGRLLLPKLIAEKQRLGLDTL